MPEDGSVIDLPPDNFGATVSRRLGIELVPNTRLTGVDVTCYQSQPSGSDLIIYDTSETQLASTSFSGSTGGIDYTMSEGTTYWVVIDPGSSGSERKADMSNYAASFPITTSDADATAGVVEFSGSLSTFTTTNFRYTSVTPRLVQPPSGLSASGGSDQVTLSWTDNSGVETDYLVYRAQSSGSSVGDYAQVATLGANTTSYTDTGLTDGERYYYRVAASESGDRPSLSNEAAATTTLPAPTGLSVSGVTADSADYSWTDNADNGSVRVEYKQSDVGTWQTFSTVALNTEAETVTGLLNGEQYDARVVAETAHATTVDQ